MKADQIDSIVLAHGYYDPSDQPTRDLVEAAYEAGRKARPSRKALASTPAVPDSSDGLMVDMVPPATPRDRWMYEQGRLAERRVSTPPAASGSAEPVAYRFPKSGDNNGYHYADNLEGEEDRFKSNWQALYAGAPPSTKLYVEARECRNCNHVGINDSHEKFAACNECGWVGESPAEDHCVGCGKNGTMTSACPKCEAGSYGFLADAELVAPLPASVSAKDAAEDTALLDWLTEQLVDTVYLDDGTIIDVGTGYMGSRNHKVSPHDIRAALRAARGITPAASKGAA